MTSATTNKKVLEMFWQTFIPAQPPADGRYLVLRPEGDWHPALWSLRDFRWSYEDASGPISDVLYYMEVIIA